MCILSSVSCSHASQSSTTDPRLLGCVPDPPDVCTLPCFRSPLTLLTLDARPVTPSSTPFFTTSSSHRRGLAPPGPSLTPESHLDRLRLLGGLLPLGMASDSSLDQSDTTWVKEGRRRGGGCTRGPQGSMLSTALWSPVDARSQHEHRTRIGFVLLRKGCPSYAALVVLTELHVHSQYILPSFYSFFPNNSISFAPLLLVQSLTGRPPARVVE